MKSRLNKIADALIEYASGNYAPVLQISEKLDEVDAIAVGINMLGEELKATTISKNYFNNIFHTVTDIILVVNEKGIIENANIPASKILGIAIDDLVGTNIDDYVSRKVPCVTPRLKKKSILRRGEEFETELTGAKNETIPVKCTINRLNPKEKTIQFLVTANDLTHIKSFEQSLRKSEEKYRKLFEDSSDCIFICDAAGDLTELNAAGRRLLLPAAAPSVTRNLFGFINSPADRKKLMNRLKKLENVENTLLKITCGDGSTAECLLSASAFFDTNNTVAGFRGMIKNITLQKETEKLIIRTIVDTQEKERIRFAKDIHDSLGQQLSAIKFYIGTSVDLVRDKRQKEILQKSNTALIGMLADMRSICFNLMPKTLENFGLVQAIRELCNYPGLKEQMNFSISADDVFPVLNKNMEIGIFRIVQEFINNAQKHGKAKSVEISLKTMPGNQIKIILQDDGKGFDVIETASFQGMGLKNVQSRVSSYNGEIVIASSPGKGTRYVITFPLEIKSNNYGSNREKKANHQTADR